MSYAEFSHSGAALRQWDKLQRLLSGSEQAIEIDGGSIDISSLVAAARYGINIRLNSECLPAIDESASFMKQCLAHNVSIYGVNTGFGGSANTRTDKTVELQDNLISFLNCGITTLGSASPSDSASKLSIPEDWVRASILIRANSLTRGHSGVRLDIIDGLVNLINFDLVPLIPLRGSISASGDLIPLSYIAGALQGKRGINVFANKRPRPLLNIQAGTKWSKGQITPPTPASPDDATNVELITGPNSQNAIAHLDIAHSTLTIGEYINESRPPCRQIVPACDALADHGLTPLKFSPKEGLSLVNGTAVSAATGALAMHKVQGISILAQILTAMSVEALKGTTESFNPFFGNVRQHPGQIEAAENILCFLKGSKLARNGDGDGIEDQGGLRQDRYSLRTVPQWIGPQLENLTLAQQQVEIECNSTTDNPLLDSKNSKVLHGGNFQALPITSAMEKVRQSLQQLGRMLFVQCSELVNPTLNNGLPPNLEAGEPSEGFLMKGVDINAAALCSELGYLANPMTPHVQTAEMGNQSLNSMAFVSARYTHTALDVISQLAASHIFMLCQALDLRCFQNIFFGLVEPKIEMSTRALFHESINDQTALSELYQELCFKFQLEFAHTASQDSTERFHNIFKSSICIILSASNLHIASVSLASLNLWAKNLGDEVSILYKNSMENYESQPSAKDYLGSAAFRVWTYVRHELKVPFHAGSNRSQSVMRECEDASVGEMISKIYAVIEDGGLIGVVMECVREARGLQAAAAA